MRFLARSLSLALPLAITLSVGCDGGTVEIDDSAIEDTGTEDTDSDADSDADSDTDTDADSDADSDTDCDVAIEYLDPGNNTVGVTTTPVLKARLDTEAEAEGIEFTLAGPDGDLEGELEMLSGGSVAAFTPAAELERSTRYTFEVTTCSDSASSSFTTVEGALDWSILTDRVFDVDLNSVTWTAPSATVGGLLVGQLDTDHLLLKVTAASETEVSMVGATGWTDPGSLEQYPCAEAIDFGAADFTGNPYFQAGPTTTALGAGGYEVEVEDFQVSGTFTGDGGAIENMRVQGYMNVGSLDMGGVDVCGLLAGFGASCVACPSSGVEECVELDVTDSSADYQSSVTLDPAIDPSTNPDCN